MIVLLRLSGFKAHRYRREQYSLTGSDGKLNYKMPKNSFPQDIIDLIK